MKKYNFLITLLLVSLFAACSTDDDTEIFEESADERINSTLANYKEQMTSAGENGWKVRFYPDTTKAGGWTFLMKFNEDNTVEMIGDVNADPQVVEGVYELLTSQGPVLNFGSYLPITELVNPSSANPESRYGSNEFIFTDSDFTGDIELVSKRNRAPFVLTEASQEDWENIDEHALMEQRLAGGATPPSVYRYFTLSDGSETTVFQTSYNDFLRFMTLRSQGTTAVQSSGHGVSFSADSIFFNPPIIFKGEEIHSMAYLEETEEFYGESNGVEARLYYSGAPAFADDDYLIPNNASYAFVGSAAAYLGDPRDNYTTQSYYNRFLQTYIKLSNYGLTLSSVQLHFNYTAPGDNRLIYVLTTGEVTMRIHVFLTTERADNKLLLSNAGIAFTHPDAIGFLTYEDLAPLHDFWTNPEGLYVDSPGNFLNFSNKAYTFVNASSPNERVLTYFVQ